MIHNCVRFEINFFLGIYHRQVRFSPRILLLSPSLFLWLYSPLDLGRFFNFLILYIVGRTPWTGDQPVARPLPTHRTTQTQNKGIQTSMPVVGTEHIIPVLEWAKTVHALDHTVPVIGDFCLLHAFYALTIIFIRSLFLFQQHKVYNKFSSRCIK
jgi:hypothetical protein